MTDSTRSSPPMTPQSSQPNHLRRFSADALAGASIFVLASTLVVGADALAATLNLAEVSETSAALALAQASAGSANAPSFLVLGVVVSVLFAFNTAFFRHLGRAYARSARQGT